MARRPFRRTLIFAGVALGTALSAAGGWRYARASAPVSGPIIIISVDTLRADHLPAYGYKKVKTPAIDMLAANGVVFERAYSHAPQTLPAHTAMLAGRLPFETGIRDDVGTKVKPGERLLAELLRDRGYETGAVVSAAALRKDTGIGQGFEFFDDDLTESDAEGAERDGTASEKIAEQWLDGAAESRALLFLHLNEPHAPYEPPDRFSQYPPYDGEIAYADEIIGRLIQYLKKHQLYDRSTIVLLSDHGEGLGDHGEQEHGLLLYEEAIRVPMIVKQESNAGAGRRVFDIVQHIDLVPTILDLAKAPIPDTVRGRSLKPLLEETGPLREMPVYAEAMYAHYHFGWSELATLIDRGHQYISAPREELYDLEADPDQRDNLATPERPSQKPTAILKDLSTELAALVVENNAAQTAKVGPVEPLANPKDKVEIVERYRAAGTLLAERRWNEAIAQFQRVLRDEPDATEVWNELAGAALVLNRYDVALDAYQHIIRLEPGEPDGYLGAADVLWKERRLDEAEARAMEAAEVSADKDTRSRGASHALLARIALARRDAAAAREQAALAQQTDPGASLAPFVEARILYDQGKYADALPWFEKAIADSAKRGALPILDLHFYVGDTLARLGRHWEAEAHFASEVRRFPQNVRARAGLATLYHTIGEQEAADAAIADMLRVTPTPDTYSTAARLSSSFGNRRQAEEIRAEARRTFSAGRP